jgi:hypothetical protein
MAPSKLQKRRNNLIIQMMAYAAAEAAAESTTDVTLTLTWTSGTGTLTPTFTLSGAIVEGDVITLSIYSDSGLTTLVDSDANTVDAAEVLAGTIDFPGIGALSAGTYWAVATLAGTNRTGTSNTETKTLVDFNPASLFSGGERGYWLDASDLSTLWQDTGGTSAVTTDGQTVKRWVDKSGNSHALTEATNGPTYRTDGSKHWLAYDGTNDTLRKSAAGITNNISALTVMAAVQCDANTGTKGLAQFMDGSFQSRAALQFNSAEVLNIGGQRVDGAVATFANGSVDRSGSPLIVVAEWDWVNTTIRVYAGQTQDATNTSFCTTGNTPATNENIRIGDVGGSFFLGKVYQVLAINRALTAPEKENLAGYMATKSGATY